jgi:hypothetical protein
LLLSKGRQRKPGKDCQEQEKSLRYRCRETISQTRDSSPIPLPMQCNGNCTERPGEKSFITAFAPKWPDKNQCQRTFFQNPFATRLVDSMTTATGTFDRKNLLPRHLLKSFPSVRDELSSRATLVPTVNSARASGRGICSDSGENRSGQR